MVKLCQQQSSVRQALDWSCSETGNLKAKFGGKCFKVTVHIINISSKKKLPCWGKKFPYTRIRIKILRFGTDILQFRGLHYVTSLTIFQGNYSFSRISYVYTSLYMHRTV